MEAGPVDAPVVSLQDVLHHGVGLAEQVGRGRVLEVVVQAAGAGRDGLLPQAGDVPDPDGLIQTGGDHQVLAGVELGAHDVVVVAGQDRDAVARLPVPDADGLVVGRRQDPGVLVVEQGGADVVQVAQQGEDAPTLFVVPYL